MRFSTIRPFGNFVCLRHMRLILGIILHLLQDLDRYSRSPKQQDLPPCPTLKALSKPFPTTATNKPAIINVALNLNFNMGAMDKSAPHQAFRHTPSYLSHLLARWACAYAKITMMPWLPWLPTRQRFATTSWHIYPWKMGCQLWTFVLMQVFFMIWISCPNLLSCIVSFNWKHRLQYNFFLASRASLPSMSTGFAVENLSHECFECQKRIFISIVNIPTKYKQPTDSSNRILERRMAIRWGVR